ncbi:MULTISPECIES: restriction endonuclease subunit S [Pseudomonas]|uniref:Type I restriction-modification system, S subunit n=2 Tax=Pseudomonas putida group TaxID=136845 RepID=Q88DS7_PSEPK|nr:MULTISPECIES: restriction endonuclease subunit S [Pseudomonas]AAN70314.1 Type I restriction-modification system, S subunit [Pseudomonas putida KT2440]KMU96484.1 restriction endonuclease subunit S [Pseudomonas putida]KMY28441.1 restriction endonuclease subunit S [Pseudomonas putida]MCE0864651.1 restriction endonuclease subunit S [Pseudomonas alloputida]MCE0870507.1 restriction endonuclease subunit S [Pseudomonas alloputida]
MTALLIDNLPLLAGAPNGIRKLRELILELAVRGKLVPQEPNDEPASELLARIALESAQLVAGGKAKKGNVKAGVVAQGLDSAELPTTWIWTSFDDLINPEYPIAYGVLVPGPDVADGVPFVRIADLDLVAPPHKPEKSISPEVDRQYERTRIRGGEILMGVVGSIGKLGIAPESWAGANIARAICRVVPSVHVSKDYIIWLLQSDLMRKQFLGDTRTLAQPTLNVGLIRSAAAPLPPLAEQHRIVAKVEELMALCDRLEAQQADAESAHVQLVQAMLDSLTQAIDAADFATSWQRLAEHFHTLFTNEFAIDALKKTLLQLAVMGKLVPQDVTDESASELLKRIEGEKQRLVNEGLMKKQKPLVESTSGQIKPALPSSWKWVPLLDITTGMDSGWSPACLGNSSPSDDVWGVLKTTAVQVMSYLQHENKELPSHLEPRPEAETKVGDILFTRAGPMNRVGISCLVESTRPKLMISDKIIRFHPVELGVYGRFVALCLNAGETAKYLEQAKSGMAASQVNISQEKLRLAPIPLAPLREQHRIVTKVDQLMKLCDTLKQQINVARSKQTELLDTLMAQV